MHLSAEKRLFRAALFTALTFFMVISMHIFNDVDNKELLLKEIQSVTSLAHQDQSPTDYSHQQRNFTHRPSPVNNTTNNEPLNDSLRQEVALANEKQTIRNLDKFDLNFDESAIVIVVQVHNRSDYLRHLVASLSRSKDIGDVLLIFSHDVYSMELNEIIEKIDFCLVCLHLSSTSFRYCTLCVRTHVFCVFRCTCMCQDYVIPFKHH